MNSTAHLLYAVYSSIKLKCVDQKRSQDFPQIKKTFVLKRHQFSIWISKLHYKEFDFHMLIYIVKMHLFIELVPFDALRLLAKFGTFKGSYRGLGYLYGA